MAEYVLGHHLKGEGKRLALMSQLLDPMHQRHIQSLNVVRPGAKTLEVGCGNGSISAWLAERVSPGGKAVAVELDCRWLMCAHPAMSCERATSQPELLIPERSLGQTQRCADRRISRLLRRSKLVDADDRLHRGSRPESGLSERLSSLVRQLPN